MNNNKHKSHKISLAWIEPDSTRKKYYDYIKSPSEPEDHTEEEQMEEMAFIEEARIVFKVNFIFNFLESKNIQFQSIWIVTLTLFPVSKNHIERI